MSSAQRQYFLLIVGLVLLIITGAAVFYIPRIPNHDRDIVEIKTMVVNFGNYEKSIPVSGDQETARREIQQTYTPFATAALLQQWRADPQHAPGRITSSPWPERIEIIDFSCSCNYALTAIPYALHWYFVIAAVG